MSRYINYDDVVGRYPKGADVGSASHIESSHIRYAEAWVDGALASAFTAPFSDNNLTVKDLCIDHTYMNIIKFKDTEKAEIIMKNLDQRVQALLEGTAQMSIEGGELLGQDVVTAWSETDGYPPTFGIGDVTDMQVSSARLYNEEQARD